MVREEHWHRVKYHLGLIQLPKERMKTKLEKKVDGNENILDNRLLHLDEVLLLEYPLEVH